MVRLLLEANANPNATYRDEFYDERTVISLCGNDEIAALLLQVSPMNSEQVKRQYTGKLVVEDEDNEVNWTKIYWYICSILLINYQKSRAYFLKVNETKFKEYCQTLNCILLQLLNYILLDQWK